MGSENATLGCPPIFTFSHIVLYRGRCWEDVLCFRAYEFYQTLANWAQACGIFHSIVDSMDRFSLSYLTGLISILCGANTKVLDGRFIFFASPIILVNFIRIHHPFLGIFCWLVSLETFQDNFNLIQKPNKESSNSIL